MSSSDLRLIELIRQNSHLYNQKDPDFRNLEKKELTWQAIADAQRSTPEICRRRFRSLRDRFVKERRHRKAELLDGTTPNPIWLKMMFLSEHLRPRRRFNWNAHNRPQNVRKTTLELQNVYTFIPVNSSGAQISNHSEIPTGYIVVNTAAENSPAAVELNSSASRVQETSENEEHAQSEIIEQESPEAVAEASSDVVEEVSSDGIEQVSSKAVVDEQEAVLEKEPREAIKLECSKTKVFRSSPKRVFPFRGKKRFRNSFFAGTTQKRTKIAEAHIAQSLGSSQSPGKTDSTCNAAFCTVVKNYLDKISNPMRLSSTRIKILSMVHDEMYSTN